MGPSAFAATPSTWARCWCSAGWPIYLHQPARAAGEPRAQPSSPKPPPVPRAPSPRETADLDALLAAGKGYRPLYQLLETEIRGAVPGLMVTPRAAYISLGAP